MPFGLNVVGKSGVLQASDAEKMGETAYKRLISALKSSGATHTQVELRWSEIERSRGKFDWRASDKLISPLLAQGIVVTAIVIGSPDWADSRHRSSGGGYKFDFPGSEQSADLSDFAAALGTHYQIGVRRWVFGKTGGNLPTGASPLYAKSVKAFSEGMKKANLLSQIAVDSPFALTSAGMKDSFDAVYFSLKDQRTSNQTISASFSQLDRIVQTMSKQGDVAKRIWLDASNSDSTYPDSAASSFTRGGQAKQLKTLLSETSRRPFIETSILASLNDLAEKSPASESKSYGLMTSELAPKLAYRVFQEAAFHLVSTKPARRISFADNLSKADESRVTRLDLDLNSNLGGMPRLWFGVSSEKANLDSLSPALETLGKSNANWLRLNAYQLGNRFSKPDGSGLDTEKSDAFFSALAAQKTSVILAFRPDAKLTLLDWQAQIARLVERYARGTKFSVYRLEFEGSVEEIKTWYPAFAKTVQKSAPERPVGFVLQGDSPIKAAEELARVCKLNKTTLNSFSWELFSAPKRIPAFMQELRATFAKSSLFKDLALLPTLPLSKTGGAAIAASKLLRALDFAPTDQSNSLNGTFVSLEDALNPDGSLTAYGEALSFLNRLKGGRIVADTEDGGVRCLSARNESKAIAILWKEPQSASENPVSTPVLVRLHGLAGGVRVERADSGAPNSASASDLPGGERDGEILLRLSPSGLTLLDMSLLKSAALEVAASPIRKQAFSGETIDIDTIFRNTTSSARSEEVEIVTSAPGLAESSPIKTTLSGIPANSERPIRFRVKMPSVSNDTRATITLKLGGVVKATLTIQLQTPLDAELVTKRIDIEDRTQPVRIELNLKNKTASPLTVKLNSTAEGSKEMKKVTLKAGAAEKSFIDLSAENLDYGLSPAEISVETGGVRTKTLSAVIGVPMNCRYASRKPLFRGAVSDWSEAALISLIRNDQVHKEGWAGPADLSAYAYLLWDEQYLYVACDVQDDVFFAPFPVEEMLKGDSVQFAVSLKRGKGEATGYGSGDSEFGMGLLNATQPTIVHFTGGTQKGEAPKGAKLSIKRDGSHTIYETAIPWSELSVDKPTVGTMIGFSLLVNDNDGQGSGYIAFGGGVASEKRPILFPPMRLVKPQ